MSDKEKLNEIAHHFIMNQYLDEYSISNPIAKDFVSENVTADMYCDESDEHETIYISLGVSSGYLNNGWYEFSFCTPGRLNYTAEKIMLEELSHIICKLFELEQKDPSIEIEPGLAIPSSKAAKDAFGFDYFALEMYDMGFTHLTGESIVILLLLPIFENEYSYLKKHGYEAFCDKYYELVPKDKQQLIGINRVPLKIG